MYWQENDKQDAYQVSDDVVELGYKIKCKQLPLDHAWALNQALQAIAPWLNDSAHNGVQLIHSAASANGWQGPEAQANAMMQLSRRTRLNLRVAKPLIAKAQQLSGQRLMLDGHAMTLLEPKVKLLVPQSTVFSRYVLTRSAQTESDFLAEIADELARENIKVKKMLGGKTHIFSSPKGPLLTRSLMISDLSKKASITLQQRGIGAGRLMGFGVVLPHKDIAAVGAPYDSLDSPN